MNFKDTRDVSFFSNLFSTFEYFISVNARNLFHLKGKQPQTTDKYLSFFMCSKFLVPEEI